MNLYRNGVFQATNTYTHNGAATNTLPFWIGRGAAGNNYTGDIDDIGVWDRVLTQSEITALSQGGCDVAANFTAIPIAICVGGTINFYDNSTGGPITWDWNFTGGSPLVSVLQNPIITYNTPGTYDVELIVSDGLSFDTLIKHNYINVSNYPVADAGPDETICPGNNVTLTASGGVAFVWSTNPPQTTATITVNPTVQTTYYVTVVESVCIDIDSVTVFMAPLVNLGSDTTLNLGGFINLDAGSNYLSYLWSDGSSGQYLTVNTAGTYWVQTLYPGGCVSSDTIVVSIGYRIEGDIVYKNVANTPINNVKLLLADNVGNKIDSLITGANGDYLFANLANGDYRTIPDCVKPWGGANSTDALAIMKHFVGLIYLYGLNLAAAEVNSTGYVNSADALMVQQRYLGMANSFPAGDWIFENNQLPLLGVNLVNDFYGLCYGDVNGSYTPPSTKQLPTVSLDLKNTLDVELNEIITVPVSVDAAMNISAISLELFYPEELINIEDVYLGKDSKEKVLFHCDNGVLRISWYALEGIRLDVYDALLNISIRLKNDLNSRPVDFQFILGQDCELAGTDVEVIEDAKLNMPKLILQHGSSENYLGYNHPNPFSSVTQIEYGIAEPAYVHLRIFNILGEEISVLVNEYQAKGNYEVNFNASNLKAGNYFYTIQVSGGTSSFTKSRLMQVK